MSFNADKLVVVGLAPTQACAETGRARVAQILDSLARPDGQIGSVGALLANEGQMSVTVLWNRLQAAAGSVTDTVTARDTESAWAVKEMVVQTMMLLSGWLHEQGLFESVWAGRHASVPAAARAVLRLRKLAGGTKVLH